MPFITRTRKRNVDEQFARFVEMIEKIHVSVPLMDVLHVPSYAKYIKDIINKKVPLPTKEVVKLTEECSAAILNCLPEKKKDPGCPTITCSKGGLQFNHALCDLGASVSVMPKAVFDKLNITNLVPTPMQLQLADSSVRYPAGIAEDIPMKIRGSFVPVDFVVLEMDVPKENPLILGRPFLSTADAQINVGAGEIRFNINGKEEKFDFRPKVEQCSMISVIYGRNKESIRQIIIEPPQASQLPMPRFHANKSKRKEKVPKEKPAPKPKNTPKPKKSTPSTSGKKVWVPKAASSVSNAPGPDAHKK